MVETDKYGRWGTMNRPIDDVVVEKVVIEGIGDEVGDSATADDDPEAGEGKLRRIQHPNWKKACRFATWTEVNAGMIPANLRQDSIVRPSTVGVSWSWTLTTFPSLPSSLLNEWPP